MLLLGAYVIGACTTRSASGPPWWLGIAAAALVVRADRRPAGPPLRDADLGALAILTLGVDILLLTELTREIGTDIVTIGAPWGADVDRGGRHPRRRRRA